MLLEHGADSRSTDDEGWQPLHLLCLEPPPSYLAGAFAFSEADPYADFGRDYELRVATMLLDKGASALSTQVNGGNETRSVMIAKSMGKDHLVQLLRARSFRSSPNSAWN